MSPYVGSDLLEGKRAKRERGNDAIEATTDYILPDRYQKFIRSVILYLVLTFQCAALISAYMCRKAKGQ